MLVNVAWESIRGKQEEELREGKNEKPNLISEEIQEDGKGGKLEDWLRDLGQIVVQESLDEEKEEQQRGNNKKVKVTRKDCREGERKRWKISHVTRGKV